MNGHREECVCDRCWASGKRGGLFAMLHSDPGKWASSDEMEQASRDHTAMCAVREGRVRLFHHGRAWWAYVPRGDGKDYSGADPVEAVMNALDKNGM